MSARIQIYINSAGEDRKRTVVASECARLRRQHSLIQDAAGGKLVWAPLPHKDDGFNVLDSAGADGTWCRALKAQTGTEGEGWCLTTDFDPLKFPVGQVAASAEELKETGFEFLTHDFTASSWPERLHDSFDLVHQRLALAGSATTPFVTTLRNFATLLKPTCGWLQVVELDISPQEGRDSAVEDYMALLNAVTVRTGVRPYFAVGLKNDLVKAGFVDVSEEILRVPAGHAVADGELREESVQSMVDLCTTFVGLARKFQLPVDEQLPERLEETLRIQGSWLVFRVVWGRKP